MMLFLSCLVVILLSMIFVVYFTFYLNLCLLSCHLLITFAINLDSDQAQHNVGPDLDPNCLPL